jgi:hypothetical protein
MLVSGSEIAGLCWGSDKEPAEGLQCEPLAAKSEGGSF